MPKSLEYISSFNSGYLSPLINSRQDLADVYRTGCTKVHNFLILSQGGVERRPATEYLLDGLDNSKLLSFASSQLQAYCVEVNDQYIRIIDDGVLVATLDSPYDLADIPLLKTTQSIDVMTITTPNKPPMELKRTSISPLTFVIEPLVFDYPPFMEQNTDRTKVITTYSDAWASGVNYIIGDTMSYDDGTGRIGYTCNTAHTSTGTSPDLTKFTVSALNEVDTSEGTTLILESEFDMFTNDMVDGYVKLDYPRSEDRIVATGQKTTSYASWVYTDPVSVSNIDFSISVYSKYPYSQGVFDSNDYRDDIVVESRVNGGPWTAVKNGKRSFSYKATGQPLEELRVGFFRIIPNQTTVYDDSYKGTYELTLASSNRKVAGTLTSTTYSDEFYVAFSDWTVETLGTWTGVVELQYSHDDGVTWKTEAVLADTIGRNATNIIQRSAITEGARTLIRISFTYGTGSMDYVISTTSPTMQGVVKILDVASTTSATVQTITRLGGNGGTSRWAEGAFSNRRGYPTCITKYKDRLVFAGTYTNPTKVWLSQTGDYYNFLTGTDDTDAIEAENISNELITWVIHKDDRLHFGTTGPLLTVETADKSSAISPSNVKIASSLQFAGSTVQGIATNETFVFLNRINRKLHEAVYDDNEKAFQARDLTILSHDITGDGLKELELTTLPEQIIFGIREDGKIATFTYERSQDVKGWAIQDIGGEATSLAVIPTETFDQVYVRVVRNGNVHIERFHTRAFTTLANARYLDSYVEYDNGASVACELLNDPANGGDILRVASGHGLTSGDLVNAGSLPTYRVVVIDPTMAYFEHPDHAGERLVLNLSSTPEVTTFTKVNNVFTIPHLPNTTIQFVGDGGFSGTYVTDGTGAFTVDTYYNKGYAGIPMVSVIQPMYMESSLLPSMRKNKTAIDAVIRFYRTIGGISGLVIQPGDDDPELDPNDFMDTNVIPLAKYEYEPLNFRDYGDPLGEMVGPMTGTKIASYNDAQSRVKSLFIVQNIPMPMTVQAIGVNLSMG